MNTLIKTLVITFFSLSLGAQPTTPEPPKTTSSFSTTHSSSYSVSKTDDDLRIKARFHKSRFEPIKAMLIDQLGKEGLSINGTSYKWSHGANTFECKLNTTSLKLYADYTSNSTTFINHLEALASKLKYAVSGGNPENELKRAQDDMKRAEEAVSRAKAELNRAKKRLENEKN